MSHLRTARERAELKLAQAAAKLGITAATLRGLEDGAFAPSPTEAKALRQLYGANLTTPEQGELFEERIHP